MEVYNGGDELSPMLGKFCGKIAPSPIISSGGQLLIKFVSDYETHGAGFSVRYEVFKTGERGSVVSSHSCCSPLCVMNRLMENSQFKFNCSEAEFSTRFVL